MRRNLMIFLSCLLIFSWAACKSSDKEKTDEPKDTESQEAIEKMMREEAAKDEGRKSDSVLINAYEQDKTTISVNDLNMKDTSFASMAKILYKGANNDKIAVVFGLRNYGKMGEAILQKEGGKAIKLPQTKILNNYEGLFSDGHTSIETKGNELIVKGDGLSGNYTKIQ